MTEASNTRKYADGDHVLVNKPSLREHGIFGLVTDFDVSTLWYSVELDKGPPWRGKYEESELLPASHEHVS